VAPGIVPLGTSPVLLVVHALAAAVWIGGLVAIFIVARAASATLEPAQRVAFFRGLGRSYLRVGVPALVVALGTGAVLLGDHGWDGTVLGAVVVALALVAALGVGVAQARRMSRLRARSIAAPDDLELKRRVQKGAHGAALLRAAIGVLSLVLIALGSVLAS
jgi:uncharacterized membrane protein